MPGSGSPRLGVGRRSKLLLRRRLPLCCRPADSTLLDLVSTVLTLLPSEAGVWRAEENSKLLRRAPGGLLGSISTCTAVLSSVQQPSYKRESGAEHVVLFAAHGPHAALGDRPAPPSCGSLDGG